MSRPEVQIRVTIYGSAAGEPVSQDRESRTLKLQLRPRMPKAGMSNEEVSRWAQSLLARISRDLKHTQNWYCEYCDKPARETVYNIAMWNNQTPVLVVLLSHNVCDAARGLCYEQLKQSDKELAAEVGFPPSFRPSTAPGPFKLSGSCAKCEKEPDVARNRRCTACMITRYCGVKCQRSDWARHKEFCKMVNTGETESTWE